MPLANFIKINNVSSLSDARYCAGMGVDILGFSLVEGSPSYVDPVQFKEITQWVAGPGFAGEFDDAEIETIKLASVDYGLDYIETSATQLLEDLAPLGIPIIYKSILKTQEDLEKLKDEISYNSDLLSHVHLQLPEKNFQQHISLLSDIKQSIILNVSSPLEKIQSLKGFGISLTAGIEEQTGLQDYGEIMDVLEALESEN